MDHFRAQQIATQIQKYNGSKAIKYVIEGALTSGPLARFHEWADGKPCEGAFLVRSAEMGALWILLIDWGCTGNYYVVLFPENKIGPIAELHKVVESSEGAALTWKYSPKKRDGKNSERRELFAVSFSTGEANIPFPNALGELDKFFSVLFELAACRRKSDKLDRE